MSVTARDENAMVQSLLHRRRSQNGVVCETHLLALPHRACRRGEIHPVLPDEGDHDERTVTGLDVAYLMPPPWFVDVVVVLHLLPCHFSQTDEFRVGHIFIGKGYFEFEDGVPDHVSSVGRECEVFAPFDAEGSNGESADCEVADEEENPHRLRFMCFHVF